MKLSRILVPILLIFTLSCEDELVNETDVQDNALDNTEVVSAVDLEIAIEEADDLIDEISLFIPFSNLFNEKEPLLQSSREGSEGEGSDYFENCADVDIAQEEGSIVVVTTFNGECNDRDGNPITGTITRTVTFNETDFSGTTTIQDLTINGFVINGSRSFVRLESNENGNPEISRTVDLTFESEGNTVSRSGERTIELTEGADTATRADDVRTITGFFEFESPQGNFAMEITTPLVLPVACGFIVSGVKTYTTDEGTSTLDYGDGTCDNIALLTLPDGSQEEITLRRRIGVGDDNDGEEDGGNDNNDEDDEDSDDNGDDQGDDSDDSDNDDEDDEDSSTGNDDENPTPPEEVIARIDAILQQGDWEVTQYIEKTGVGAREFINRTEEFDGFVFDFRDGDQVSVSQNGNVVFETTRRLENDDRSIFMVLDFDNATGSLGLLDNRWPVISGNDTRIGLIAGTLSFSEDIDNRIFLNFERL